MSSLALLAQTASHAATGWWTSDHILALANVVLAAVGVTTIIFGLIAISSSGKVAEAAGKQADASEKLATASGKQAAASDRIAESALAENLAGVRPQLVEVPKRLLSSGGFDHEGPGKLRWARDETLVCLTVPVRNVGPGVAFVQHVQVVDIRTLQALGDLPQVTTRAIAPGDTATVISSAYAKDSAHAALSELFDYGIAAVDVFYSDVNGGQHTLTRLSVSKVDGGVGLVLRVELYHTDGKLSPDKEPFVSTKLPDDLPGSGAAAGDAGRTHSPEPTVPS